MENEEEEMEAIYPSDKIIEDEGITDSEKEFLRKLIFNYGTYGITTRLISVLTDMVNERGSEYHGSPTYQKMIDDLTKLI